MITPLNNRGSVQCPDRKVYGIMLVRFGGMVHGKGGGYDALTVVERAELEGLAGRRRTAQGFMRRGRIVLAAADGLENKAIAQALDAGMRAP